MKTSLICLIGLLICFVLIPEKDFNQAKNNSIKVLAKEYNIPPYLAKLVVNTKVGRKLAYIFFKKKINNKKKTQDNLKHNP